MWKRVQLHLQLLFAPVMKVLTSIVKGTKASNRSERELEPLEEQQNVLSDFLMQKWLILFVRYMSEIRQVQSLARTVDSSGTRFSYLINLIWNGL